MAQLMLRVVMARGSSAAVNLEQCEKQAAYPFCIFLLMPCCVFKPVQECQGLSAAMLLTLSFLIV